MNTELLDLIQVPKETPPEAIPEPEEADVCGDRSYGVWRKFRNVPGIRLPMPLPEVFSQAVMVNVEFRTHYWASGCGGTFTGHAKGELIQDIIPKPDKVRGARKLWFDNYTGHFFDAISKNRVSRATALFLLPGLSARYIP